MRSSRLPGSSWSSDQSRVLGSHVSQRAEMIGVGPFLTIPLALAAMGGPQAMLGWILGAFVSLCDGMVWSELGSAMPLDGGPYHYMLQAFGPRSYGPPV